MRTLSDDAPASSSVVKGRRREGKHVVVVVTCLGVRLRPSMSGEWDIGETSPAFAATRMETLDMQISTDWKVSPSNGEGFTKAGSEWRLTVHRDFFDLNI